MKTNQKLLEVLLSLSQGKKKKKEIDMMRARKESICLCD